MVVPFAAGGSSDTIGRIMADGMRAPLGQSVIIENVGGASGNIGVGRVARAAPDGYTLILGSWPTHVLNAAIFALPYDPLNDFEPVSLVAAQPLLVIGKKGLPPKDLLELIAWLKASPHTATQATAGAGGASHVAGVFFQRATGTRFQFVPYRGSGPGMQDLLAGQIDMMIDLAASSTPQVRAGTVKAYAVTAKSRSAAAPDVPTVDEAGLPGFHVLSWHAIWVPKATPKSVIAKLNGAVVEALADPSGAKAAGGRRAGDLPTRAADAGGAECLPVSRDREMVADHPGSQHQGGVKDCVTATGGHEGTCSRPAAECARSRQTG